MYLLTSKETTSLHSIAHIPRHMTYTLKKSMTSGDNGEAPDPIKRTLPPSFSFILLNTNLSHIGDGFRPEMMHESTKDLKAIAAITSVNLCCIALGDCIRLGFTIYFFNLVRSTMFLYLIYWRVGNSSYDARRVYILAHIPLIMACFLEL